MARILLVSDRRMPILPRVKALETRGHCVAVAEGYGDARAAIADRNHDLLVTPVRLGTHNGLHLALHARRTVPPIAAIVIDVAPDPVTEFEAHRSSASYAAEPLDPAHFASLIDAKLTASTPRRWPRTPAAYGMAAKVREQSAQLLDMSYGGVRLELEENGGVVSGLDVTLPEHGVSLRAKAVWTRKSPRGGMLCGAELTETDPNLLHIWQQLVDNSLYATSGTFLTA